LLAPFATQFCLTLEIYFNQNRYKIRDFVIFLSADLTNNKSMSNLKKDI